MNWFSGTGTHKGFYSEKRRWRKRVVNADIFKNVFSSFELWREKSKQLAFAFFFLDAPLVSYFKKEMKVSTL
jgi:hypothetical protein